MVRSNRAHKNRAGDNREGGEAGGHGDGVARQCAGLVHRAQRAICSIISRLPPKAPTGMPPPMTLPR